MLSDVVIKATEDMINDDDANRLHLDELAEMAKKFSKDEQRTVAEMFDTDVMFNVLLSRFKEMETLIRKVKFMFEER